MINLYNASTENEQIDVLSVLSKLLEDFDISLTKQLVMAGDFNLFFNSKLEAQGGNPTLKKKSLAKRIEFKETYDLCDIWRVRNTKSKRFTFTQKHSSDFIQRRLGYILISNNLQEFVTMTDILTPISTDHSPVLFSLSKEKNTIRGTGLWKFNSSLTKDQNYKTEIKNLIRIFSNENELLLNHQLKWELLKYEFRKFTIKYTKYVAKEKRQLKTKLESQLKKLEVKLDEDNLSKYESVKNELDEIYDHIAERIRIRCKCDSYEQSEKSTNFFLILEKQQGSQNTIKKLVIDDREITEQTHILKYIREFYENLFKTREQKNKIEMEDLFSDVDIPKLSENQVKLCEENLTEKDLYKSLKSMQSDKSPGNNGLTKEFYETFWTELKKIFVDSVSQAEEKGILSTSQRQVIIKLIEKQDRDKRFIQNWRLISLLNVDLKVISKALSEKLLKDLISSQQTTNVKNRYICECGRLISDIIEIAKIKKIEGFLVTMDIGKAFDSLDHKFLISALEKYGFGKNFISWVKILLRNQESCVLMAVLPQSIFC